MDNLCIILMETIKDPHISAQPGERGDGPSDFGVNDVCAVSLRAVDHDAVLAGHLSLSCPQLIAALL